MLTIYPSVVAMPTKFAEQLIEQYGTPTDYRFAAVLMLSNAQAVTGTKFNLVNKFEPWTEERTKSLLGFHPVAIWNRLEVRIAPRAGVFGRMCTFYGGWAPSGVKAPTTVEEMMALHNAVDVTYGGAGDPGLIRQVIACPFDDTLQDILKAPYGDASRPVFYYAFSEVDVVTTVKEAPRFMLTFQGSYVLKGRY